MYKPPSGGDKPSDWIRTFGPLRMSPNIHRGCLKSKELRFASGYVRGAPIPNRPGQEATMKSDSLGILALHGHGGSECRASDSEPLPIAKRISHCRRQSATAANGFAAAANGFAVATNGSSAAANGFATAACGCIAGIMGRINAGP
jgi:hypothetical protein